jgi:outer membrane scaffolding protein for murein synthesis (MipA/OmpV family)
MDSNEAIAHRDRRGGAWLPSVLLTLSLATVAAGAGAQQVPAAEAASAPAAAAASASAPSRLSAQPTWEGALGVLFQYGPSYQGSESSRLRLRPGLFLRYGRYSVTTTGGFVTRRNEEVQRGLSADLIDREKLRVSLSLRVDGGRDDGDDPMLHGLGRIRATVRGRLQAVKDFGAGWKLSAALSPDLLGRQGGALADVGLGYEWPLTPALRANAGITLTAASQRYMQSYFGVTPEQSQRSGHPVYTPSAGLRDIGWGVGLRADLGPRWLGFLNAGATQLAGPTLDSPLTRRHDTWRIGGGIAWRF